MLRLKLLVGTEKSVIELALICACSQPGTHVKELVLREGRKLTHGQQAVASGGAGLDLGVDAALPRHGVDGHRLHARADANGVVARLDGRRHIRDGLQPRGALPASGEMDKRIKDYLPNIAPNRKTLTAATSAVACSPNEHCLRQ